MEGLTEIGKVAVMIAGEKREETLYERQAGFDGQTGERLTELVVASGFDGQTGEKIYSVVEKGGFDPMSGEQLYRVKSAPVSPAGNKSNKKKMPVIIGIGAVIAVALVVTVLAVTGVFMGKHEKIALAVINTVKDDTVGNALFNAGMVLNSEELTAKVESTGKISGANYNVNALLALDSSKGRIYSDGQIDAMGVKQSFGFLFDDSSVRFAFPDMTDSMYVYDYTKKNNGFIADTIESETNYGKIDDLNDIFQSINNIYKKSHKTAGKIEKEILKAVKKIRIEDIEPVEIEIDEKYKKCNGYEITITGRNIAEISRAASKVKEEEYGRDIDRLVTACENLGFDDIGSAMDRYDDISDEAENISDIRIRVYLNGGKLAEIDFAGQYRDDSFKLEFNGGDTRTSNMTLKAGIVKIKKSSEISGGVETGTVSFGNSKFKYTYDKKSGRFSVKTGNDELEGVFKADGKSIAVKFESDYPQMDMDISISKGAKISKLRGREFDLGKADEDDLKEEAEAFEDAFGRLSGFDRYGFGGYPAFTEAVETPAEPAEETYAEEYYDEY